MEADTGSNHPEKMGRLPILDVEVWVGESAAGRLKILHSHYMKEVANRSVMSSRSAHGETTKRNVMVNEICRIMKNCSVYLSWEELAKKVSYFMKRMAFSGYSELCRYEVLKMALSRHQRRVRRWEGGASMFEVPASKERAKRQQKKRDWFKAGSKYESVMFVQPTPGAVLKKKIQKVAKKNKVKMKVVEKAGSTMKSVLQRSDPYMDKRCNRESCVVCTHGKIGECWTRGCVYQLKCKEDDRKYRGQTGRSLYERTKEEMRDWNNQEEGHPLWKHSQLYHEGERFEVDIKVMSKDYGKASRRLITESIMIETLPIAETMNSKKEWTYTNLNKVNVV